MRNRSLLALISLAATVTFLTGCPSTPVYPACETDEHCKVDGQDKEINYHCVNKQCQQCSEDTHCSEGERCSNFMCEVKPECERNDQCAENQICQSNKCIDVACTVDEDCQAGERCEDNNCVAGCTADQECGAGMECVDGECQEAAGTTISSECQPMDAASGDVVSMQVVNFDFNQSDLRVDTRGMLSQNARCLEQAPDLTIVIEGHCDERGTQEYNLALGEHRANAVMSYLRNLGIDSSRMRTVSKGENEPVCGSSSESCHERNRRVLFIQRRN